MVICMLAFFLPVLLLLNHRQRSCGVKTCYGLTVDYSVVHRTVLPFVKGCMLRHAGSTSSSCIELLAYYTSSCQSDRHVGKSV
ncbi:hypothetical protein EDD16DRAFT_1563237 [Pisolithus croceorrhizus]|nr:hypothetical protein EDD16DRAFT_1563237 [Pisolithus croceorrhizus]